MNCKRFWLFLGMGLLAGWLLVLPAQAKDNRTPERFRRADQAVYQPAQIYAGSYEPQHLYKLIGETYNWVANRQPARLEQVRCGVAKKALSDYGYWVGRIDAAGYCVDGDPVEWVSGNFMNFLGQE